VSQNQQELFGDSFGLVQEPVEKKGGVIRRFEPHCSGNAFEVPSTERCGSMNLEEFVGQTLFSPQVLEQVQRNLRKVPVDFDSLGNQLLDKSQAFL